MTTDTPTLPRAAGLRSAPGGRAAGRLNSVLLPAAGLLLAGAGWWLATLVFDIKTVILPPPNEVWDAFRRLPGYLLEQTWVTLRRTVLGFAWSVAAGLLLGLVIAGSAVVERMFYPLLVGVNAIPKVALAPMLVAWLGFGEKPVTVMVFLLCFFPIVLSTATGLMSTPAELAELSRSLSASRWHTFVKIRFPAALPQIFVGLKVGMPLAAVGAVIGEFQSGVDGGLGFVILSTSGIGDTPTALAAIVLVALISIPLFYAVVLAERLLLPWVRETTSQR
ncbi:MAG TPA: ABC transporter permease [Pilimelia sp.]|nr:ABC transporter permease [Pilimelia sp.]